MPSLSSKITGAGVKKDGAPTAAPLSMNRTPSNDSYASTPSAGETETTEATEVTGLSGLAAEQNWKLFEPFTAWERVLETTEEHDKHAIETWKDELNNLLIFTGLFSAVVTAFTVESYTWLQQGSPDTSVLLLAQISLQLASFTSGNTMINSTAPALPLANVTQPFTPTRVAVNVNILWVLSLTLSLIAALFAIAAQQWLRHLHLPPQLAARTALKLRQLRYESLRVWQIPGIISLLPMLLQVAVVLFLVGLLLLLDSLDHAVVVPFIGLAGVSIILFALTAIIPLFNVYCPYKSPIIPTALIVLQWLTYPAALLIAGPYALIVTVCESRFLQPIVHSPKNLNTYLEYVYWPNQRVLMYVRSFGTHIRVDLTHFWTHRELNAVAQRRDTALECRALLGTLMTMRQNIFRRVKGRVTEFMPETRMRSALLAVIRALGFHRAQDVLQYYPRPSANASLHNRAEHCVSVQQGELLLDALPRDWNDFGDPMGDHDVARILFLVYRATTGGAIELRDRLVGMLWDIRGKQTDLDLTSVRPSVPTLLMLETLNAADLELIGAARAFSWAQDCFAAARKYVSQSRPQTTKPEAVATPKPPTTKAEAITTLDPETLGRMAAAVMAPNLVLSATAIAFMALGQFPDAEIVDRLIRSLVTFLREWKTIVKQQAHASRRKRQEDIPLFVLPKAIHSICDSLLQLAHDSALPSTKDGPLANLMELLGEVCADQTDDLYVQAIQKLDGLEEFYRPGSTSEPDLGTALMKAEMRELDEARPSRLTGSPLTGWRTPRALSPAGGRRIKQRIENDSDRILESFVGLHVRSLPPILERPFTEKPKSKVSSDVPMML